MNIVVVDEGYPWALAPQAVKSVRELVKGAKQTGYPHRNILKLIYVNVRGENELAYMKKGLYWLLKNGFSQFMPAVTPASPAPVSGNKVLTEGASLKKDTSFKTENRAFDKHSYVALSSGQEKEEPKLIIHLKS